MSREPLAVWLLLAAADVLRLSILIDYQRQARVWSPRATRYTVRRAPNNATPTTTDTTTAASKSVDTAMIAGERLNWTSVKSFTGKVIAPGPEMNKAITTSSND